MSKLLLKEYIRLIVEKTLLEADPMITLSTVGTTGARGSLSTSSASGTKTTRSSEATGSGADSETDDTIKNLEGEIEKNNMAIKGLNQAAGQMFNAQKSSVDSTKKTGEGLTTASRAAQTLSTTGTEKEEDKNARKEAELQLSTGLQTAATGLNGVQNAGTRTQNALQNLMSDTKVSG